MNEKHPESYRVMQEEEEEEEQEEEEEEGLFRG